MENQIQTKMPTLKEFFEQDNVKRKFQELLGKKSQGFITSVLQCVASNELLKEAEPATIYHAAAVAATLDLPLNNALGMAYIVPYKQNKNGQTKVIAQFQMGYKSFIQLSQRSGQFKTISAAPIYEGQLVESNPLAGYKFDFTKKASDKVIGYAAFFQLLNGFEKTLYMTTDELKKHGTQYSQSFKKGFGLWKDNFEAMAIKTVIKLLLSKFAPLSIEMQKAVIMDQALISDSETDDVEYIDNEPLLIDKEAERIEAMIGDCKTPDELKALLVHVKPEQMEIYDVKMAELTPPPAAIPDEDYNKIILALEGCNTKKEVDAVAASWDEYKGHPEFEEIISKAKEGLKK